MDGLEYIKARVLNQYAFLFCLLFFIDAFLDLYFGYVYNFALLLSIGILYLLLFFFTKVRFNDIVVFISLLICCFLVFLFSTLDGFKNGITYYYFAIILAVVFLFNERKNYILGIVVLITILFLFSYSSLHDLSLFENTKSLSPHRAKNIKIHTFMQVFLITVFHGYFIVSKNRKITELCLQQERSKHNIALLREKLAANSLSPPLEYVVKLAMEDDGKFLSLFKMLFPSFYEGLSQINPEITLEEYKFCALLKLGFTTKEIACYANLAVRTVQTKKNRLRKSFTISSDVDLYVWINTI